MSYYSIPVKVAGLLVLMMAVLNIITNEIITCFVTIQLCILPYSLIVCAAEELDFEKKYHFIPLTGKIF